jgi:hypothetical protein
MHSQISLKFSVYSRLQNRKQMSRAKTQSTPSSEKYEMIILCALGVLAGKTFLSHFVKS